MDAAYEIVIKDVRLRDRRDGPVNVGIRDGRVAAITDDRITGDSELDGDGNLLTASFVDAHLHLCKVDTLPMVGDEAVRQYAGAAMGQAMRAIELASAVKEKYAEGWIYDHARRVLLAGLKHGVTHVQAFADTDTRARLEAVRALLRLRDEFRGIVDVRVVAFPQDGILRDSGAEEYVREALALGADVVGGIPWIEHTDREAEEHVVRMMRLAKTFDRDVAMLVDDAGDPGLRTTEMLADAAVRAGWVGRVTACHARAMSLYPEPYFRRLVELARRAGMAFVTDPHTGSLHLRVEALLEAGLAVAIGQDDIADAYYPYGQHNMLEVAFLASHILGTPTFAQMEMLYDMVTSLGARVLRLSDYGVAVGKAAHLVVLRGTNVHEVLREHRSPRYVISHGRLVAENSEDTRFHGVTDPRKEARGPHSRTP
ncbi:MAG: amidohydrolase family protein [Armatimonadota bacterium]